MSGLLLLIPSTTYPQASPWLRVGGNAVPIYTWADPVPRGGSLDELRIVQPTLMLHAGAWADQLQLLATFNFEGFTIENGELALGDWGEGFMDRRHPHTYVHEVMLTGQHSFGGVHASLAGGKGFAPFGTDDPMSRPVVRYPVNHHLAQILERAILIGGVRTGRLLIEGGLFNGDEPERPTQWPNFSRFGDSWSARVSVYPVAGLEVQASHADVHSPEHRPGSGTDQSKWSASARWQGPVGGSPVYALLEWARTSEAEGFFVFHSILGEGAWTRGHSRLHYRFERTERPEEERLSDPFRSARPHLENSILGITRWTIHTLGYGYQLSLFQQISAFPFVEVSRGHIDDVAGGLFDPEAFYGKADFWSFSIGARLGVGLPLHRMGRYGVARDTAGSPGMAHHAHHD